MSKQTNKIYDKCRCEGLTEKIDIPMLYVCCDMLKQIKDKIERNILEQVSGYDLVKLEKIMSDFIKHKPISTPPPTIIDQVFRCTLCKREFNFYVDAEHSRGSWWLNFNEKPTSTPSQAWSRPEKKRDKSVGRWLILPLINLIYTLIRAPITLYKKNRSHANPGPSKPKNKGKV